MLELLSDDGPYRSWQIVVEEGSHRLELLVRGVRTAEEVWIDSVLTPFRLSDRVYETGFVIKTPDDCDAWKFEPYYSGLGSGSGSEDDLLVCIFLGGHAALVLQGGISHPIWRAKPDRWDKPPPGLMAEGFPLSRAKVLDRLGEDTRAVGPLEIDWLRCRRGRGEKTWACDASFYDRRREWTLDLTLDASGEIQRWNNTPL